MTETKPLRGLVPAVFTPMHDNGEINYSQIPAIVEHLKRQSVEAIFVLGTTGEGPSLTVDERKAVAAAYVESCAGELPVIIHVGHNSLSEAKSFASHAQALGADAISAIPPTYFRPDTVDNLIECLQQITDGAPQLPFYYYHIPAFTGHHIDIVEFLNKANGRLSSLAGIKFSSPNLNEFQNCLSVSENRFTMLFGVDEMYLGGHIAGAHGAVGSTYNFATPLYQRILAEATEGNLGRAQHYQLLAVKMTRCIIQHGGLAALKSMMKLIEIDCGPSRLPIRPMSPQTHHALEQAMRDSGFFEWAGAG